MSLQLEILQAVVCFLLVDMVNHFVAREFPSNGLLHDNNVLKSFSTIDIDYPVSGSVNVFSAAVKLGVVGTLPGWLGPARNTPGSHTATKRRSGDAKFLGERKDRFSGVMALNGKIELLLSNFDESSTGS